MQITINGELQTLNRPCSVAQLLGQLGLAGKRVAVELNGEILPRSQHDNYSLSAGDKLEIVHAIGGGQY